MNYKTCTHTYDSGRACKSAAVTGREFCGYHLRYRGRLMRMAQCRARHQRFDITLQPLDSLFSIQSALCQVAEGLAADMIDTPPRQGPAQGSPLRQREPQRRPQGQRQLRDSETKGAFDSLRSLRRTPYEGFLPPTVAEVAKNTA